MLFLFLSFIPPPPIFSTTRRNISASSIDRRVSRCRGANEALSAIIGNADCPDSRMAELLILEIKGIPCPPLPRFLAQAVSDVTRQINDFRRCPRPAGEGFEFFVARTFRNFLSG